MLLSEIISSSAVQPNGKRWLRNEPKPEDAEKPRIRGGPLRQIDRIPPDINRTCLGRSLERKAIYEEAQYEIANVDYYVSGSHQSGHG